MEWREAEPEVKEEGSGCGDPDDGGPDNCPVTCRGTLKCLAMAYEAGTIGPLFPRWPTAP